MENIVIALILILVFVDILIVKDGILVFAAFAVLCIYLLVLAYKGLS